MSTDGPTTTTISPAAPSSPPRECDLVMKGGVTSGVVYPLAICELATHYRFRSIGGASAGAIAAAAAAAAEYARQTGATGDGAGFARLARLPDELGAPVGDRGPSRLRSLFQPSRATRTLFDALLIWIAHRGAARKALATAALVARRHWLFPLLAVAAAALIVAAAIRAGGALHVAVALLAALSLVLVGLALATWRALRHGLDGVAASGAGLCTGHAEPAPGAPPPLTTWLTDLLDQIAGRSTAPDAPPLTFGDLEAHRIELVMMTTNLTHGRPYRLPLEPGTFFFRRADMARLFPPRVVEAMVRGATRQLERRAAEAAEAGDDVDASEQRAILAAAADELLPLPAPADLPVVVATRMSLSFPILLSAVPLHAIDWTRRPPGRRVEPCWFSDGGICSNLPIHFFDALLPTRPTFALNLKPPHPDHPVRVPPFADGAGEHDNVWMPERNAAGRAEQWCRIGEDGARLSAPALVGAVVETMQSWNDNMQCKIPGYRDRIVHINHRPDEGGLNLDMPPEVIARLARRGGAAGQRLVEVFALAEPGKGFDNHLWVRYRSAIAMLEDILGRVHASYFAAPERRQHLERLLESSSYALSGERRDVARWLHDEFDRLVQQLVGRGASLSAGAPMPRPELRARPRGS